MDRLVLIHVERPDGSTEELPMHGTRALPRCLQLPRLASEKVRFGVPPQRPKIGVEEVVLRRVIRADHWGPLEAVYG